MKYPSVILQSSEHMRFSWRDGYSDITTEELKALFLESRLATSSIEAELQRRGSHKIPKVRVNDCMQSIRQAAHSVSILERLDNKAIPIAKDLRRLMTDVPPDRNLKVYQEFLNDVQTQCGPEYTLLCAIGLGKHRISNLRADEKISLLALLKQEKTALHSTILSSLALDYGITSGKIPTAARRVQAQQAATEAN
ncbi:hypothetical protein N7495_000479 [Penicillium taxi]|uniref:uncharacterized protein n=1 Tax=Penicillium taxi TaxID=168475 RepID=UPI002544F84B|nr:uncharacterized protein N7495_000479 [Penicillium taxi]KAJ5907797.1 hypothetical protein N7495_000479 [Penicillium taxi]